MQNNGFEALLRAFRKMKTTLFSPFSLPLWFTLAFPAFLATLDSGGGFGFHFIQPDARKSATSMITDHFTAFLILLAVLILLGLALTLLFYWLSSRGRFLFLDMLVRGADAERLGSRWRRFQAPAASFFRIKLGFFLGHVFCALLAIPGLLPFTGPVVNAFAEKELLPHTPWLNYNMIPPELQPLCLGGAGALVAIAFLGSLGLFILNIFFHDYGALLMYRKGVSGGVALLATLEAVRKEPFRFLKYLLLLILIQILASLAILAFLIVTCCCIGYFLLLIPYISTVVLLPILYTRWQFILEYFGDPGIRSAEVSPPPAAEQGIDRFIIRPERQSQNNGPF